VASLAELVQSPSLRPLVGFVARSRRDPTVESVALVEKLDDIGTVEANSIVLLTGAASAGAGGYRFDVALRRASDLGAAALVLCAPDIARVTPTAAAIVDRSNTAILGTTADVDLAELAITIARELAGDGGTVLLRAHAAVRAVKAHPVDGATDALVKRAGAAIGIPLSLATSEPSGPRSPVLVEGSVEGWLTAPEQAGDMAMGLEIVLDSAARAVGLALARSRHAQELPLLSSEEVLTELLSAPPQTRAGLVLRARNLGLAIDGWHVVARLQPVQLADAPDSELDAFEQRRTLAASVLRALRAGGAPWQGARAELGIVLVRMYAHDPGFGAASEVARELDEVLARGGSTPPATLVRCGVGGPHPGPAGLVSAAAEAKAAVIAARASGRTNEAVPFDSLGLRRTLVEWYASDTARESVASVLAPLVELGGARAERLIQTLHVYLDTQSSLTKTAARLNMHRNAVSYRVKQIFSLLDVDEDNPDDLLLLQLACRARELG
jgi:PucR C-terminal helix-turn-helix domain/GGDEF-like domain